MEEEEVLSIQKKLFPHQWKAIELMEEREKTKQIKQSNYIIDLNISIYADISGFGKTISLLGLILRDKMAWDLTESYVKESILSLFGNGCIVKKSIKTFKRLKPTLIVANGLILKQWVDELRETNLTFFWISNKKKLEEVDPNEFDVLLVNPSFYNTLMEKYCDWAWKRFIVDEPTYLRISSMQPIVAGFIWFITATPELFLRQQRQSYNFISTIFTPYMNYNLYKNLIVKNEDEFVRSSFLLPPLRIFHHPCFQPIHKLTKDHFHSDLGKEIERGNIVKVVQVIGGNITELSNNRVDEETFCPICLEIPKKNPILIACCHHTFCGSCLFDWWRKSNCNCPTCRESILPSRLFLYVDLSSASLIPYLPPSKKDRLLQILNPEKIEDGLSVVLFSSFPETFNPIKGWLEENSITFGEYKGTMSYKAKMLDYFSQGKITVLLLNSPELGIRLVDATDLIFFHLLADDYQKQVQSLTYRAGRTKPLRIHHLVG